MLKKAGKAIVSIIIVVGCTLIGFWVGVQTITDKLVRWQLIGSPPGGATEFLGGSSYSYLGGVLYRGREACVYVESGTGKIYRNCTSTEKTWEETQRSDVEEVVDWGCSSGTIEIPQWAIDVISIEWCGEWDWGEARYAIRNDGTVWKRYYSGRFPDWAIKLCCSTVIGFIAGLYILGKANASRKADVQKPIVN